MMIAICHPSSTKQVLFQTRLPPLDALRWEGPTKNIHAQYLAAHDAAATLAQNLYNPIQQILHKHFFESTILKPNALTNPALETYAMCKFYVPLIGKWLPEWQHNM